jgi:hypothetical protein
VSETSGSKLRHWLLVAVDDLDGGAPRSDVHQRLADLFSHEFTPEDRRPRVGRAGGEPAWKNNVDSLYDRLKKRGVFQLTRRGDRWQLTSAGRAEASGLKPQGRPTAEAVGEFKPKDASDYLAVVPARTLKKSREHESLLSTYGTAMMDAGWTAITNVHPRDMELSRGGNHWLVEVKMVYGGNATQAARAAVAQLLEYRHFYYRGVAPGLVGLFSESLGGAYEELLESIGIATVWRSGAGWSGGERSRSAGLVPA